MSKCKYICPHCSKPIKATCHTKNANYFDCNDCNLRYRIQNGSYLYEYTPTTYKRVKFKGGANYEF